MTFKNMVSIFNCTYEESLALWDYLMFLRVKSMLKSAPLPAITKEEMEFEKSREASPLTTQRLVADIFGVPVELTNNVEQDKLKAHPMAQRWYDDMEAIRQGNKAPGDTAPTQAEWIAQVKSDVEGAEAPYPPMTKEEFKEKERQRHADQTKINWRNCFVGMLAVHARYYIPEADRQMIRCSKCNEELWFGRVKDGTDIVCNQCGTMTKFQYDAPAAVAESEAKIDKVTGVALNAAKVMYGPEYTWVQCGACKLTLYFISPSTKVDVTCYGCGHVSNFIDVVKEERA